MAKHSKRHNIRHKKALTDAKKSSIYAKVGRIIEVCARKGTDPTMNPSLQLALAKARYNGLPREVIDKAIKKWAGQNADEQFEEIIYEGYGPNGSAILVKALSSNRNRSASTMKLLFNKYGGTSAEPGAVIWQFVELGNIVIDGICQHSVVNGKTKEEVWSYDPYQLEMDAIEWWADDILMEHDIAYIACSREDFITLSRKMESLRYHILSAELVYVSDTTILLGADDQMRFDLLVGMLEADDDVYSVWHNVE